MWAVETVQPDSGTSDREALRQLHSGSCPQRWIYFGPCFGSTARRLWCCQAVTGAGWQPLGKACYRFALPSILGPCVVPSGHSAWRQHRPAAACLDARHLPRVQSIAPRSWMLDHIACRRDRTVHPELGLRDGVHVFDGRQPWRFDLPKPTVGSGPAPQVARELPWQMLSSCHSKTRSLSTWHGHHLVGWAFVAFRCSD